MCVPQKEKNVERICSWEHVSSQCYGYAISSVTKWFILGQLGILVLFVLWHVFQTNTTYSQDEVDIESGSNCKPLNEYFYKLKGKYKFSGNKLHVHIVLSSLRCFFVIILLFGKNYFRIDFLLSSIIYLFF